MKKKTQNVGKNVLKSKLNSSKVFGQLLEILETHTDAIAHIQS